MSSKPAWPSSGNIFAEWELAMRIAHDVLLNGKVSERVRFLQEELLGLCDLDLGSRQTTDVFLLLTSTYPRYTDAESRGAVERVGSALVRRDAGVAEQVVVWLKAQSVHASAPGDIYALLCWSCALLPLVIGSPVSTDLVRVLANLLDALLGSARVKAAVRVGAVTRVRRALRGVCCLCSLVLSPLLIHDMRAVPLLGVSVDVVVHLKSTTDPIETRLSPELKAAVLEIYCKEVLESRVELPGYVLKSLDLYIHKYVGPPEFDSVVLPALERSMGRGLIIGPHAFLSTYTHPISVQAFRSPTTPYLDPLARRQHPRVYPRSFGRLRASSSEAGAEEAVGETREAILALPRARKTAGGGHRAVLYGMLGCLEAPSGDKNDGAAGVRRAWWMLGAGVLWNGPLSSETYVAFARALVPALDAALGAVGTGIGAKEEALWEACLSAACLLRLAGGTGGKSGELAKHYAAIVVPVGDKPAWLFNERVYSRVGISKDAVGSDAHDQEALWLVRALQGVWAVSASGAGKNLRLGSALLHLALRAQPATRTAVLDVVRARTDAGPVVCAGIGAYVARNTDAAGGTEARVAAFLGAGVGSSEETIAEVDSARAPPVHRPAKYWIDVCQRAGADPREVVARKLDHIIQLVLAASAEDPKTGLPDAAYSALTTLTFVAPETVVPRIMDQLRTDIDPSVLNALTEEDLGMWRMPEGSAFVDVLTSTKGEAKITKGKDFEIARWEAEVRNTLEKKKASSGPTLTKPQQALLAGTACTPYISSVVRLLLEGALARGALLAQVTAFETYLELAKCSSERLESFRMWVGIATLRSLKVDYHLVLRVLHRLRSLSEQAPFDSATFSYTFPLLAQVLTQEALEQVALALDIIKFHSGECLRQTMEILLLIIRQQPKLSKDGSSALVDLGEAAFANASRDELDVLLQGTLMQEVYVRNSCLQTLQPFDLTDLDWSPQLWVACHDDDEQNARLARHVWEDNGLDVPEAFLAHLLPFLGHDNSYVRRSAAAAIAEAVEIWPQEVHSTVTTLQEYYRDKAKILAPEFDQYGMVIAASLDRSDPWQARVATSHAFELLSPLLPEDEVEPPWVIVPAEVRRGMLSAGTAIIDLHGASRIAPLISMFENHLSRPSPATETGDQIKEAVVILFGRVARHLDASDSRVPSIVDRLVDALKTPSEQVQIAVSDCLSPLVKVMRPKVAQLVDDLMDQLSNAPKYATRRGAAYGLAGVLKGTGIAGMKEFDIIRRLRSAAEDKKRYEPRQGTMFAFETLSNTLGRLFEPYITYVLPLLLTSFGDSTADVREATQDAARIIMGNLSGYGVKLILPSLLSGLDEKQWRTKKGSIELLGMMAYCSPRQLSLSLPIVIPQLTDVLTDSHAQVRSAANKSLKQFGEVITNPEIQSLVPVLLKALVDPAKTPNALSALLKTSFMHYIDHSSLALVVPILERGLRERGADTKKKAAQIVGNLASLTDSKDFVPYLSGLLPLVHLVLVDPVPEARATAAKALGTLVERLGEGHFPDLVPGLLRTLKTDTSGVDRQGLGMERLEGLLPDIIANAQSPRSTVREGFMSLLVYLPATFGTRFQPHLPKIISPILSGLADVEEYVREAAMRAGRMVVTNYSSRAIDLLLPELEHGMFDPGWRIRQSSITLVGELLFKVSGISGKASDLDEDEVAAEGTTTESSRRALVEILGVERRDRILAALYMVRQDGVGVVRQSSIQIWKALVHNTPRTVREILPELIRQILYLISSEEFEQQETAGRTVGEICRKFGDRILGEVMSILRTNSSSTDPRTRESVCLMLSEIMENSTDNQREGHEDDIISIVRMSLVDDESNVRSAAAKAFDILQEHLGPKAIDQTIPTLLDALRQPGKGSGTALQALREVMSVRASTVFPVLIPTLTAIPMTLFNARALAALVTVAWGCFEQTAVVVEDDKDEELQVAVDEAIRALFASISDAEGLNTLMMILLGWAKHDSPKRRVSGCNFFAIFCEESELDSSLYRVDWIRQLVPLLEDSQVPVHTAAWGALDVFVKSIPKDELEPLVVPLRRSIESTGSPGNYGVSPAVPIIIAGLTTGSNEQREQAAYAIGDLVERTEENAIKPFVVPFTGPLIRTAILSALTSMLERIPTFVKPFFPQLQRTFVKSTSDPSSIVVRNKAAQALGVLMRSQPRVDPVVTELITGIKSNDDTIASSLILALANVVKNAAQNLGEKARESCVELATEAFRESHDDHYILAIGELVASLAVYPDLLRPLVDNFLVAGTPLSPMSSHTIVALLTPDEENDTSLPNLFQKLGVLRSVAQKVQDSAACDRPTVARPAREARDLLKELD
ncbi:armadillo-type protein [Mycena rebaudengoi]|nr:armadillo-type protein [Mycena rebaudengoi]